MADNLLFPAPAPVLLPVQGSDAKFPVNRIFCVGRNYQAHAAEMGVTVDKTKQEPFYFMKDTRHVVMSGATVPYALRTQNLHYELELVIALDKPAFQISREQARDCIYGYAVGLDMTRRDLQAKFKERGHPWDLAKNYEDAAIITALVPKAQAGDVEHAQITLKVDGEVKQDAQTSDLIWDIAEIIEHLSTYYHLQAGDLIYTGTPEGVGPVVAGNHLVGTVSGLPTIELTISE
ncbi:MAG: fumarylacetoacetate hydrolase family protein [Pelistega sp.]|nr:fumarylacetoacetate hydrolase family protein [Pelistega sp.]